VHEVKAYSQRIATGLITASNGHGQLKDNLSAAIAIEIGLTTAYKGGILTEGLGAA